jgi:hypothetical protein
MAVASWSAPSQNAHWKERVQPGDNKETSIFLCRNLLTRRRLPPESLQSIIGSTLRGILRLLRPDLFDHPMCSTHAGKSYLPSSDGLQSDLSQLTSGAPGAKIAVPQHHPQRGKLWGYRVGYSGQCRQKRPARSRVYRTVWLPASPPKYKAPLAGLFIFGRTAGIENPWKFQGSTKWQDSHCVRPKAARRARHMDVRRTDQKFC